MSAYRALIAVIVAAFLSFELHADDAVSTGTVRPELQQFDELMTSFLKAHDLPGAALAIGHRGKLIYARGFGYADVVAQEKVQPDSLFRIASISKPVTAAAILKLVQTQKLKLDDKAFAIVKLEAHRQEGTRPDPRLADVTISHLLQHTGGWDREKSFDPMFQSTKFAKALNVAAPAKPEHVIRYMLGQPLDFTPGERYAYSNFGYCVLGRVIEVVTKMPYEEFVQTEILRPLGITAMKLGHTRLEDRAKNEVRYYSKKSPTGPSVFEADLGQQIHLPYGAWYLEAMDAHGGWLASAPDLVKFSMAFRLTPEHRLLNDNSKKLMIERPRGLAGFNEDGSPREVYYGLGWQVRPVPETQFVNIWHAGGLPGTSTFLAHLQRVDLSWAVLFNSRDTDPPPSSQIDLLLNEARKRTTQWPGPLTE